MRKRKILTAIFAGFSVAAMVSIVPMTVSSCFFNNDKHSYSFSFDKKEKISYTESHNLTSIDIIWGANIDGVNNNDVVLYSLTVKSYGYIINDYSSVFSFNPETGETSYIGGPVEHDPSYELTITAVVNGVEIDQKSFHLQISNEKELEIYPQDYVDVINYTSDIDAELKVTSSFNVYREGDLETPINNKNLIYDISIVGNDDDTLFGIDENGCILYLGNFNADESKYTLEVDISTKDPNDKAVHFLDVTIGEINTVKIETEQIVEESSFYDIDTSESIQINSDFTAKQSKNDDNVPVTYSIVSATKDNEPIESSLIEEYFSIDEITGVVKYLCPKELQDGRSHMYEIVVNTTIDENIKYVSDKIDPYYITYRTSEKLPLSFSDASQDVIVPYSESINSTCEVCTCSASLPEQSTPSSISYSIISGNDESVFSIDSSSGTIMYTGDVV